MYYFGGPPPLYGIQYPPRRRTPRSSDNERHVRPAQILPPGPDILQVLYVLAREVQTGECQDTTHDVRRPAFSVCVAHVALNEGYTSIGARIRFPDTVLGVIHSSGVLLSHVRADAFGHNAETDPVSDLIHAGTELLARWNHLRTDHRESHGGTARAFHMRACEGNRPVIAESHTLIERMFAERGLQVYEFQYHRSRDGVDCVFATWKHRQTPKLFTSTGCCFTAEGGPARITPAGYPW